MNTPSEAPDRAAAHRPDDDLLLKRIGEVRDHDAFEELFRRHTDHAYNLALNLTGNAQRAEDAVQEAFLTVWTHAHRYRPGSAKAWILGIVAKKGLKMNRKKREVPVSINADLQHASGDVNASHEQSELLAVLRELIWKLPQRERAMVALHYGAGLTQREIAKELGIPARTLSTRLATVLGNLREKLSAAGLGAALPHLNEAGLTQAVTSGNPVPARLASRLAVRVLAEAGRQSARVAVASTWTSTVYYYYVVTAMLAVGIGAYIWARQESPVDTSSGSKANRISSKSEIESEPTPKVQRLRASWSFKDGPAEGLPVVQGKWKWHTAPDGIGEMEVETRASSEDGRKDVILVLPNHIPSKPIRMDARVRLAGKDLFGMDLLWLTEKGMPSYVRHTVLLPGNRGWNDLKVYVLGKWMVHYLNGQPNVVCQYEGAYPAEHLSIIFSNYHVRGIRIRELAPNDPEILGLNPEALIEKLKKGKSKYSRKAVPPRTGDWLKVLDEVR